MSRCKDTAILNSQQVQCEREWDHAAEAGDPMNWHRNGSMIWNTPTGQYADLSTPVNTVTFDSPTVPRVATSLDDLRVGQVVALVREAEQRIGTVEAVRHGANHPYAQVKYPSPTAGAYTFDLHGATIEGGLVVILSDPPPEPVTVSRAAFDRLAAIVDHSNGDHEKYPTGVLCAAIDLVDEVRRADA